MSVISNLSHIAQSGRRVSWDDTAAALKEADGEVSVTEVQALLADATFVSQMDAGARQCLLHYLSVQAPPTGSLGALPDGAKLFAKEGVFLPAPDAPLPKTPLEHGQSLYHAARIFAEPGQDPAAALSLADKTAVVERVLVGLAQCRAPGTPPGYEAESQAAQQRSASATVLREMVRSLEGAGGEARLLQDKALSALLGLLEAEDNPGLRDHMSFHLQALKGAVPAPEQVARIEAAFEVFAPTKPPYDSWFAGDNDRIQVVCHTGEEFFADEVNDWLKEGFKANYELCDDKQLVLEKTFVNDEGVETPVRLKMIEGKAGTFDDMDDDDTHVVMYSGHSGWGLNIPAELADAPDAKGPKKVMAIHLCCGQGAINQLRDRYPDQDLLTTRYSSTQLEDHFAQKTLLDGFAARKGWDAIHQDIAAGGPDENGRNNYITPADEYARMKARDQDGDGRADLLDRLYDFDTFDVAGDSRAAFVPKVPSHRNQVLAGERLHNAVQFLNVSLGFSDFLSHLKEGNPFIADGFFTPAPGEELRMVKIRPRTVDIEGLGASTAHNFDRQGTDRHRVFEVQLNPAFAHMSEEALKAAVFFEVARLEGSGESAIDRALQGLMLVAHGLTTDAEYGREQLIFDELRHNFALPDGLTFSDAGRHLKADYDAAAGSDKGIERWKASLVPEVVAELSAALRRTAPGD